MKHMIVRKNKNCYLNLLIKMKRKIKCLRFMHLKVYFLETLSKNFRDSNRRKDHLPKKIKGLDDSNKKLQLRPNPIIISKRNIIFNLQKYK